MLDRAYISTEVLARQNKNNPHVREFSTKVHLDGEVYSIDSEDHGIQSPFIFTRISHRGKIIYSRSLDYRNILRAQNLDGRLKELIEAQQQKAIAALKTKKKAPNRTYKDYHKEIEILVNINNHVEALSLSIEATEQYPNNPVILSYKGFLEAFVEKQYSKGVNTCKHALKLINEQMPIGKEFFLPLLYLNLGKAYGAAQKKQEARDSLTKGLNLDNTNEDLLYELQKLNMRRKPTFSFLKRSHPLNKYIGKLTYKLQSMTKSI
jgi:tetratricopeptide (TPR) repeat protein